MNAGIQTKKASDQTNSNWISWYRRLDEEPQDDSTLELLHELENVDWSDGADAEGGPESSRRHTDTKLQTALTEERLFLNLLKIHTEAETYIQEQGVNVLFLALGFLHWYESTLAEACIF